MREEQRLVQDHTCPAVLSGTRGFNVVHFTCSLGWAKCFGLISLLQLKRIDDSAQLQSLLLATTSCEPSCPLRFLGRSEPSLPPVGLKQCPLGLCEPQ